MRKYLLIIILTLWLVPSQLALNFEGIESSYVNPPSPNFESDISFDDDDVEQSFLTNEEISQETNIPIKKPIPKITQEEEYLELKEFSEHYHFDNGTIKFSSRLGDQNTWDGSQYQYYVWNDTEKSIQYANSKVTFYDWYAMVEQNEEVVVDDCRWIVEYWREQGGGEWRTLDLYNHQWFDPIIETKKVTFIQGYDDTVNFLNVSFIVTNNAAVKINIDYYSGEEREVRFVWQLTGMTGNIDYVQNKREFSFSDIIISCNDTEVSTGFEYNWEVSTKKLDVRLGSFNVVADDWIFIDPTFSEKQETDTRDFLVYYDTSDYTAVTNSDIMDSGESSGSITLRGLIAWDTGLTSDIASTSDASMSFYVNSESVEGNEYNAVGLYDDGTADEYWSESEAASDEEGAYSQTTYWNDTSFYTFNGLSGMNVTITDADVGPLIDQWVIHHNGDSATRQYIPIKLYEGDGMDINTNDYNGLCESSHATQGNRPTLTFTYTLSGGNNAPAAAVHTEVTSNLYAGINFTAVSNHTDSDGSADLDRLYLGLGASQFDITFNSSAGTGSLSVSTDNGSTYVSVVSASGSSITNGFQVTWTIQLDWDFPFDDLSTIDTHARSRDDEPEYSTWDTHNTNANFENDLEAVGLNVSIVGTAEYGGVDGWIEDNDWFRGGVEVTANGSVEYEGSSQTFNSSYAATVNVTLLYDGANTSQADLVILSGVFSGITYTPTSAAGLDTTAYFDVQVMGIPTNGSDVTAAGIEITSKRDNENPSGYSISLTADTVSIGYVPNTGYYDDNSVDVSVSGATDGSGSGLPSDCYAYQIDAEGYGSWTSSTTNEFTSVADGDHTLYVKVRDNVANEGSADSTTVTVDTDSPTGFTLTLSRHTGIPDGYYAYETGGTIYFNSGETDYFTVQVNDDGTIQNSLFWKLEWDKNSVFETAANDTSGLPDSKNFNYNGDSSGTFLIRVVNNAGNYQTFTYTATEDVTNPTFSVGPDTDTASIGYAPINSSYDDDDTVDFTASGAADGGSGLPTNRYSWNNSAWESSTTKQYGGQSDGNISLTVYLRDNVGNNGTESTWIIVDTDSPSGFTWTWSRVNDTYPCIQNSSGFYFDDSQNNYTTVTINDDGTIQNSLFWKIEWDKNSILEAAANDTSGLPDNKDFYYLADDSGTFLIRVINNAGNYQTFTIECYDTYDVGGPANNAPVAVIHTAVSGTLYAGINFTFVTNHTDSDGSADLAFLFSGLGDDQFDITFNATAGTGSLSVSTENGTGYVISIGASGSAITNGYQVTWTVRLDWDWSTFDDSSTIDTWAQSWDDEPSSSSWATDDSNVDYENDLEIVGLSVSIVGNAEFGGVDGWIEDNDWFRGGVEVTANGSVEYEGSSQTFNSSYAASVNVELVFDGGDTSQTDTIILNGVFSGVTYTPTSASGIDTTAYFDVKINGIPTGGTDVTGAAIEITSKRDNEDPTTTFYSIIEDDPHIYIYTTGQIIYFSDNMGATDQLATIAVNASDSSGSDIYCVTMSAWDDDAEWNDTTSFYERQYSTDSSETSGSITLYAIDNVGNIDSTPVTITMTEDTTAPTFSVSPDTDTASIGYAPINSSYDDDSTIDFTASGANDGGSGLPTNRYSWNNSAWESSTTKQYSGQSDGNISLNVVLRDNVGNNASEDTWIIVDTDSPAGFTITWTRMNGTYPIAVYDGNMTIYFDPGASCNNYTTVTVNDDGEINNSLFWKIEWDKNSVFEVGSNDTSGLPDNMDFYYLGDTNGTFLIRVINNAGNYQTFSYDAYDTLDGGCGEPPTAPSGGPSDTAGVIQEPPFWYSTQFAWYIWMTIWAGAGIIVTGFVLYYFMKQFL